jgi:hypothetical protein
LDPRSLPLEGFFAAGAALILFALVQTFRLYRHRGERRRALMSARERGALGEIRAEALLRKLGFKILGRQVGASYGLGLDGEHVAVELRADYVVGARGRRYVAEVKTGRLAPRIDTAATRRQLLEYRLAFDVDGVLLVDAESDRVHRVEFPLISAAAERRPGSPLGWLLLGVVVGALAVLAIRTL